MIDVLVVGAGPAGSVAALVLAVVVVYVNRRAYRCIEELEDA